MLRVRELSCETPLERSFCWENWKDSRHSAYFDFQWHGNFPDVYNPIWECFFHPTIPWQKVEILLFINSFIRELSENFDRSEPNFSSRCGFTNTTVSVYCSFSATIVSFIT